MRNLLITIVITIFVSTFAFAQERKEENEKNHESILKRLEKLEKKYKILRMDMSKVAYYPFNGNSNDESGKDNNGQAIGCVLVKDRKGNNKSAYKFDGIDDFIKIENSNNLEIKNELTVSLWISVSRFIVEDGDDVIMDKMTSDPKGPFGILLVGGKKLEARFTFSTGEMKRLSTNLVPKKNSWHHCAITFKSGKQRLYYDGIVVSSANISGTLICNNLPINIGKGVERDYYFSGIIDDISIYNKSLSESEIYLLYKK